MIVAFVIRARGSPSFPRDRPPSPILQSLRARRRRPPPPPISGPNPLRYPLVVRFCTRSHLRPAVSVVYLIMFPEEGRRCRGFDGRTSAPHKPPVPTPVGRAPATPKIPVLGPKSHCAPSTDAYDAIRYRRSATNGLLRSKLIIAGHASSIIELGHFAVRLRGAINRHLEAVFLNGERGYYRQRGGLEDRSGGSVIAMVGGAAAIAFWRTPWSGGRNAYYVARVFDDRYSIRRIAIRGSDNRS